jgi:CRISPR/Cas system-associated endoribonuclease Cas2
MNTKKIEAFIDPEVERIPAQDIILAMIGFAGILSLAIFAPGAIKAFSVLQKVGRRYQSKAYYEGILGKLEKKDLVRVFHKNGEPCISLTDKGRIQYIKRTALHIKKQNKKWDQKWRIVSFDISEQRRVVRDLVRQSIVNFGFVRLQDSVWVYPYDCEELITLLKGHVRVGTELLYIEVSKLENDTWLKKHFKLS